MRGFACALVLCLGCSEKSSTPKPEAAPTPVVSDVQTLPVTTASKDAEDAFRKGQALADDRRNREAIALYQQAISLDPSFALAHATLGWLTTGPESEAAFAKATALSANVPASERRYIEYLKARHEGDDEKVRALRIELARELPGDWRTQADLGEQYYEEEKWDLAVQSYSRAVEVNPRSSAYNALGYALAMQGKLDLAVDAVRQYVKVRPNDPNPLDSLGEIELMAGHLPEAEKAFVGATALSSEYWEAWHGVAQVRQLRGDVAGANAAIEKARATATELRDRLQIDAFAAWMLLAQGKSAQALEKVQAIERQAAGGKADLAWADAPLLKASLLIELRKPAEALPLLQTAIERAQTAKISGLHASVLRRRALTKKVIAEADLGKLKDAEKTLAQLLDEAKKSAVKSELRVALHLARAMVWKARGETPAAIGELKRCDDRAAFQYTYEGRPDDAYCLFRLLRMQEGAHDEVGAASTRERLLRAWVRDPVFAYVQAQAQDLSLAGR